LKIFLSWSGDRSRHVAEALRGWLKKVIQAIDPWMSEQDLQTGGRWNPELETALADSIFGVSCLTKSNLQKPWILFEAGALASKVKDRSFLCPYLIDLEFEELGYPLATFHGQKCDKAGTFKLVCGINNALRSVQPAGALPDNDLAETFKTFWPKLKKQLKKLPNEPAPRRKKDQYEMVMETWESVRELNQTVAALQDGLAPNRLAAAGYYVPSSGGVFAGLPNVTGLVPMSAISGFWPPAPSPADRGKLKYARVADSESVHCSECGNDQVDLQPGKPVPPKNTSFHHDNTCRNCGSVVHQFHTISNNSGGKNFFCPPKCPFHTNEAGNVNPTSTRGKAPKEGK
jgi:hypothetical protein